MESRRYLKLKGFFELLSDMAEGLAPQTISPFPTGGNV